MSKWQRVRYLPNLPLGELGERVTASQKHRELSKNAAKGGMVLLKNDGNILPLERGVRVALFGKGCFDYVKGGGGSGDVTVEYTINLHDGLKSLKEQVTIFEALSKFYRDKVTDQYSDGAIPGMTIEPAVPEELLKESRAFTDTAVICISRFSGEGWDRNGKQNNNSTYKNPWGQVEALKEKYEFIYERGDYYLSYAEEAMVKQVKENFPKVIVVLNVGGIVDTGWFVKDSAIKSVLLAWQGGMEGGLAAAELMCGLGNPCGKLSDTFANRLEDYPSTSLFYESDNYVDYSEDIFVGYRYFETIPGAAEKVNYPFGFGLSYTSFHWTLDSAWNEEGIIRIMVSVTNTGNREGKEVLQVYTAAPQGLLGKAARSLVAFQKTRLLKAGETQLICLDFSMADLASYDDLGKIQKSAYVLEAGEYEFFLGNSVRSVQKIDFVITVSQNTIIEQLSEKIAPKALKKRLLADGSFEELPVSTGSTENVANRTASAETTLGYAPVVRARKRYQLWDQYKRGIRTLDCVADGAMTIEEFLKQMTDEEVAHLLGGQPNTGTANTFGYGNMPEYGIPNIMTADGPAGLRIEPECGVYTTAWPCATLLACSWDRDMIYEVGVAGAREVKENNMAVWLAPAINIHRSPLCGRNFEYYSEDPYLTGEMGAAMVKGIQSQQIGATVKHFAIYHKETNNRNSDSRVSERATREIYLKAFELIVKKAKPWSIMSSYNIINGCRASENRELLEDILRGEWGWDGMVTTDWWTYGKHDKEVKAGNDVKMGCGYPEQLLEAKEAGLITREEMEVCAGRILELILKVE